VEGEARWGGESRARWSGNVRFVVDVRWGGGSIEGEVQAAGDLAPTTFVGIAELVGLLQGPLGPRPGGGEVEARTALVLRSGRDPE
jgi:hypothetical protein